jgi:hypothetical protein
MVLLPHFLTDIQHASICSELSSSFDSSNHHLYDVSTMCPGGIQRNRAWMHCNDSKVSRVLPSAGAVTDLVRHRASSRGFSLSRLCQYPGLCVTVGTRQPAQPFHIDYQYNFWKLHPLSLVYIDSVNMYNLWVNTSSSPAVIWIVPGSHMCAAADIDFSSAVPVEYLPGDALIFHTLLTHAGGVTRDPAARIWFDYVFLTACSAAERALDSACKRHVRPGSTLATGFTHLPLHYPPPRPFTSGGRRVGSIPFSPGNGRGGVPTL